MNRKFYLLFFVFGALILMGQGCISFKKAADDGGVFRSSDQGDNWERKTAVLSVGQPQSIGRLNISSFEIDPSDQNAIYVATNAGVYMTYDAGDSWQKIKVLDNSQVASLAVDPADKCNIYASIQNKIYKSVDCGRSFGQPIYDDPRGDNRVTSIDVDSYNSLIVYAGTSKGDLLKSLDGGKSWKTIKRFNNEIKKVLIDQKNDTRIVYVGTKNKGVYRTANAGGEWSSSEGVLRKYNGGLEFRDMVYQKEHLILATKYGLFKTTTGDNWSKWEPIDLLTAPGSTLIYSLAVNPQNANEIYYGTASTFYRTADGGKTWTTKKLPTTRTATALVVHPQKTGLVYLGVTKFKK